MENSNQNNNQWFHDILNSGLDTFIEYWGYKKIADRWENQKGISFSQGDIRKRVEELQQAQEYDSSGVTTYMLLRAYMHDLLQETTYTASDLILNWDKHRASFEQIAKMRSDLERPEALEILKIFEAEVVAMVGSYEAQNIETINKLIVNPIESAFLRQSAYKAVNRTLKTHQFLQGTGSTGPLKVHKKVYEFWNINSLINAAAHQIFDGAALCLIRDQKTEFASFFCFAIKAGETLTILTDREKGSHPKYHEMSRRPDRDLEARWNQNWFPYDLLDLDLSADGKRLFMAGRDSLVPYNASLVPLANIGSLHPQEIIWLGLVLDLIAKKYGSAEPELLPEISYTGEMIRYPDALVPAESSLIIQGKYKHIELPKITAEDLEADKIADNFSAPAIGFNRHIVDRFKDQVPTEVFNLIGDNDIKLLRASNETLAETRPGEWRNDPPIPEIELRSASPLDFGSPEQLDKDRKWNARFNQISVINTLAQQDFENTKDEIKAWYKDQVTANKPMLIKYIGLMECNLFASEWLSRHDHFNKSGQTNLKPVDILSFYQTNGRNNVFSTWREGGIYFGGYKKTKYQLHGREREYYSDTLLCFSDDATIGTIGALFTPTEAAHLAFLAGCEVNDLPIQIRHWRKNEPYHGNSILERIDPEDWHLHDPWRRFSFEVGFVMSKSYFNRLRKDMKLPKYTWKNKPDSNGKVMIDLENNED